MMITCRESLRVILFNRVQRLAMSNEFPCEFCGLYSRSVTLTSSSWTKYFCSCECIAQWNITYHKRMDEENLAIERAWTLLWDNVAKEIEEVRERYYGEKAWLALSEARRELDCLEKELLKAYS